MSKSPIGSGPYKFKNWAQGDKIEFEAYDGYYKGEPSIKNLTYKIIPNSSTATMALESGEIDLSLNVSRAGRCSNGRGQRSFIFWPPGQGTLRHWKKKTVSHYCRNRPLRSTLSV